MTATAPAPPAEPDVPVFDQAGMLSRLLDDEELAQSVADSFLEDMPRRIAVMKTMLAAGDITGAQREAHTIKGASASMGAERMRAVAADMETAAKTGDVRAVTARVPDLEARFDELRRAVLKEA